MLDKLRKFYRIFFKKKTRRPAVDDPSELDSIIMVSRFDGYIYFLLYNEQIVYIGKSIQTNITKRIGAHLSEGTKKFNSYKFFYVFYGDIDEVEAYFVSKYRPIYNQKLLNKSIKKPFATLVDGTKCVHFKNC